MNVICLLCALCPLLKLFGVDSRYTSLSLASGLVAKFSSLCPHNGIVGIDEERLSRGDCSEFEA